jgi:hypothetical protein
VTNMNDGHSAIKPSELSWQFSYVTDLWCVVLIRILIGSVDAKLLLITFVEEHIPLVSYDSCRRR